jgi:hypothetical protein
MRLLVYMPTYTLPDGTEAMSPESAESVRSQQIDGDLVYEIGRYNPFPGADHRNVTAQYQRAQAMMLEGEYDALLTFEHDNVLPDPRAVQRLLDTPGDVVYAPYVLRHGVSVLSTWQYIGDKNLGESLTLHPDELEKARAAVVWRVCGVGHGCTLFRRHVMERIDFHCGEGNQYAPDIPFARDALAAGLISNGRFDVPVLHRQNDAWLHPYETIGRKRYYCRVTVNALTPDGSRFRLVQGEYVQMTPDQAYDLARAGFITIPDERLWEASGLPPGRDQQPETVTETATAEPDAERAVLPQPKRRKGRAA